VVVGRSTGHYHDKVSSARRRRESEGRRPWAPREREPGGSVTTEARSAAPPPAADDGAPAVELRGITKRFPGVVANHDIVMAVRRGTIHAVIGENGAGKSTLMKILYGMYRPDEGEVYVDGRPVNFHSPQQAIAAGIGMVHQHF